jgi:adhesin/invasin
MLAGAGMALTVMFSTACDDDDPDEPPVATELNITSGDNQTIAVSTESAPMTVTLLDQNDDPMSGRTVTWAVATGDGTLASTTSVTTAQGVATMTFTSGTTAGNATVTATVTGLPPATFDIVVQ